MAKGSVGSSSNIGYVLPKLSRSLYKAAIALNDECATQQKKAKPLPPVPPMKRPFDKMNVGDPAIVVPLSEANAARLSAFNYGLRNGRVFKSKKAGQFIRIWRIA